MKNIFLSYAAGLFSFFRGEDYNKLKVVQLELYLRLFLISFKLSCVRQIWHIMNQFSVAWFCKWKCLRKLIMDTNIKTPTTLKICVLDSNEKVTSTDYSLKALREILSLALRIFQSFRILFILPSPFFAVFSWLDKAQLSVLRDRMRRGMLRSKIPKYKTIRRNPRVF